MPFSPIEIVEDIKQGKMVIVCDDEDRENEGDLTMAAELVTADDINFMAAHGRSDLLAGGGDRRPPRHTADGHPQRFEDGYGVHGLDRGEGGHHDGHLRRRQGPHLQGRRGRGDGPGRPRDARARIPLAGEGRGCLQRAGQTEAAVDLARLAGLACWCDLRDHERGWHDGPRTRPGEVLQRARRRW